MLGVLVQGSFIILAALYVGFAFIVTRQITIMSKTIVTPFSPAVKLIGMIHLVVALVVWLLFLLFL